MTATSQLVFPDDEPVLVELRARVVLFGPVHEGVVLSLHPHGVSIRRIGLLGVTLGPDHHYFSYADIDAISDGVHLRLVDRTDESRSLTLSGNGAAVLQQVLDILGEDRTGKLFAAQARRNTRFGIQMNGVALGGETALLFVPLSAFGLLTAGTWHLPVEDIRWVVEDPEGIVVWGRDDAQQGVHLLSEDSLMTGFASWWLERHPLPPSDEDDELTCMWLRHDRVLSPARVRLVEGGVELRATAGPAHAVRESALQLELRASSTPRAGTLRARLQIRGLPHRLWLALDGDGHRKLSHHLLRNTGVCWPDDFSPAGWRAAAGQWEVVRLMVPGEGEVVVPHIALEVGERGILVPPNGPIRLGAPPFQLGKRMRIEVVNSRRGLFFTAVVGRPGHPDGGAPTENHRPLLVPLGDGPTRRPPRRAVFRALVARNLAAFISNKDHRWSGRLVNLSAEGAGIELDGSTASLPEGSIVTTKLTFANGQRVRVRGEVRHLSRTSEEGVSVGVRFIGASEHLRSFFQRAALELERESQQLSAEELDDPSTIPDIEVQPSFVEMDTVDLTL